jgi:NAD-dependent dihydropyrimidine dehydrogenase PreA subunit
MSQRDDVYRRLAREIDKMPVPFTRTVSGVELKILKHLFTPEEAEVALNLNILPETLDRIHKRAKKNGITLTGEALESLLNNLVEKGAISGGRSRKKGKLYSLAQLAVGMFEYQIDRLTPGFVEDFEQYVKEQFHRDLLHAKTQQMRTIPVSRSVTPDLHVEPYNDIRAYVRNFKSDISVANCVCRQATDVTGGACRHSDMRETCLQFGSAARWCIEKGVGRAITKEEALAILDRAEEAGFILQPQNAQAPRFLCCCCVDCCHALKVMNMHPRPAELFTSNYHVTVDPSLCTGCALCVERCGMKALNMVQETTAVNLDRCIGCGVCTIACPTEALRLQKKDRLHVPPKTQSDLYKNIMMERFGLLGTLKTVARVLSGRKA